MSSAGVGHGFSGYVTNPPVPSTTITQAQLTNFQNQLTAMQNQLNSISGLANSLSALIAGLPTLAAVDAEIAKFIGKLVIPTIQTIDQEIARYLPGLISVAVAPFITLAQAAAAADAEISKLVNPMLTTLYGWEVQIKNALVAVDSGLKELQVAGKLQSDSIVIKAIKDLESAVAKL
jgi:hypothetical protein